MIRVVAAPCHDASGWLSAGGRFWLRLSPFALPRRALPTLGLALVAACDARPAAGVAPGVLVIAIDGLRADHLSVYGYDRDTSPALNELAQQGLCFADAQASAPQILPAHAALLTGCEPAIARQFLPPEFEGTSERRWHVPARAPQLAVEFLAAGYATAAFVDSPLLSAAHGFGLGFQRYEVLEPEDAEAWEGAQTTRILGRFLQWQRELPADRPWFAYLHLAQLERSWSQPEKAAEAYFPPRPELSFVPPVANTDSVFFAVPRSRWRGRVRTLGDCEAAYDDEIHSLDAALGDLFAGLRRAGRFDSTSIHVLGTFGLQFGEAGLILRAGRYSPADLCVPWITRPRTTLGVAGGRRAAGIASLIDVAPTLLELEGLPLPPGLHGRSQAAVVRGTTERAVERPFVFASCGLQEGCAVIGERYVLEYLIPLGTADAQLRRSWAGQWSELALQPRVRFYDRRANPYPPLDGEVSAPDGEIGPFRQAAVEWLNDMRDLCRLLQAAPGAGALDREVLRRLAQRGYTSPADAPR